MEVSFKKGKTKSTQVCKRKDGSTFWSAMDPFMIVHDLAHFCVESKLRAFNGFYRLIATGIDISDFENKQKINSKNLPSEAKIIELIVGQILTERADNKLSENFNATLAESANALGIDKTTSIRNEILVSIRKDLEKLLNKWNLLPVGDTLTLHFNET
ncbi:MAG: hypothetical protein KF860_12970 [Cyclobacteriaceae bacterium]|nr:hypothetical protein [Cyclobacteriaceae bacterium]